MYSMYRVSDLSTIFPKKIITPISLKNMPKKSKYQKTVSLLEKISRQLDSKS